MEKAHRKARMGSQEWMTLAGTYEETYDGMICSDGGAESGPKMMPLFQASIWLLRVQ